MRCLQFLAGFVLTKKLVRCFLNYWITSLIAPNISVWMYALVFGVLLKARFAHW
jgi:hypothetical protein